MMDGDTQELLDLLLNVPVVTVVNSGQDTHASLPVEHSLPSSYLSASSAPDTEPEFVFDELFDIEFNRAQEKPDENPVSLQTPNFMHPKPVIQNSRSSQKTPGYELISRMHKIEQINTLGELQTLADLLQKHQKYTKVQLYSPLKLITFGALKVCHQLFMMYAPNQPTQQLPHHVLQSMQAIFGMVYYQCPNLFPQADKYAVSGFKMDKNELLKKYLDFALPEIGLSFPKKTYHENIAKAVLIVLGYHLLILKLHIEHQPIDAYSPPIKNTLPIEELIMPPEKN
ncbi:MAG: hypothetical protein ACRCXC_01295 [Legionella sp.]